MDNFLLSMFSIAVLLIVFVKSLSKSISNKTLLRVFQLAILLNIFAIIVDLMGRCDGLDKAWYPFCNQVGNFLLFLVGDFLAGAVLIYVSLYINQSTKIKKWVIIMVASVCLIKLVLTALSPTFHILYYIDEQNIYHRTSGIYVSLATTAAVLCGLMYEIFANYKKIRLTDKLTFFCFFIFQGIAIGLQYAFYGFSLIYPASSLALLILYINIQEGQMKSERDQLININEHDALTNLFNLNKYKSMFETEYKQLVSCGVMYFDINYLKKTNDEYGHAVGDILIRNCASSLLAISSPTVHGYRMGGDELMIIACDITRDDFDKLIVEWQKQMDAINVNSALLCSMAMGSAWASGDFSIETLSGIADEKMYIAKKEMKGERA